MKKTYKKPGVAIMDKDNRIIISNNPELETCLKQYCSQIPQCENGMNIQAEQGELSVEPF